MCDELTCVRDEALTQSELMRIPTIGLIKNKKRIPPGKESDKPNSLLMKQDMERLDHDSFSSSGRQRCSKAASSSPFIRALMGIISWRGINISSCSRTRAISTRVERRASVLPLSILEI